MPTPSGDARASQRVAVRPGSRKHLRAFVPVATVLALASAVFPDPVITASAPDRPESLSTNAFSRLPGSVLLRARELGVVSGSLAVAGEEAPAVLTGEGGPRAFTAPIGAAPPGVAVKPERPVAALDPRTFRRAVERVVPAEPAATPVQSSSGTPVVPRLQRGGSGPWWTTEASWYGPGFYGNGTACGQTYTREIIGVAHRTLRCGRSVQFRYRGRVVTAPVIDRGPYGVAGRDFDLSAGLCRLLDHCFTGPIEWRLP